MKRFTRIVLAVFLFAGSLIALCLSKMVAAGEAPPANPYAGDIWTRSTGAHSVTGWLRKA